MNNFYSALLLGIAYCAPPGVVTAETIRRGFANGFSSALLIQLGSIIGDLVWALIALTGSAFLFQNMISRTILTIIGIILLIYLAYLSFRDFITKKNETESRQLGHNDFSAGIMLSLSNPFAIAFWAGASTTMLTDVMQSPQQSDLIVFFLAFTLGTLIWCAFFSFLVSWGRTLITKRFFRMVNFFCGCTFLYFGFQLGYKLLF